MRATAMQRQRFLFAALGLLTLWRWALLPTLELSPDEALAVFHGNHDAAGAPIGPGPLVSLLGMVPGGGEFGVRFFAPLLALAASLAVWRLARGLFDAQSAGWAVVIMNVLPAFNLAAVTLTSSTVVFALVPLAALCVRTALLHASPLHWAWWAAAACVAGTVLAQPPALGTLAAVVLVFALPRRLRHHLHGSGFVIIITAWVLALCGCLLWQGGLGFAWPEWRLVPSLFRWAVLASPLLLALFVAAVRLASDRATLLSHRSLPLGMLLPLAALDFFYGPHFRWPDTGGAVWMTFAAMLLAHRGTALGGMTSEARISLRTIAIVLAALQSAFVIQTDLPRTLGLPWRFSRETSSDYAHFFTADPSRCMRGWKECAKLVTAALNQRLTWEAGKDGDPDGRENWFVLTDDWRLLVELEHYAGRWEPVHSTQEKLADHAGRNALFITNDPAATAPPETVKARFQRWEVLSVARVMHAGNEVRWLKIFACHDYRAPDL
ncbi:MAG: glycosyltransferase family 39 protein [Prosthecobacter sp.]